MILLILSIIAGVFAGRWLRRAGQEYGDDAWNVEVFGEMIMRGVQVAPLRETAARMGLELVNLRPANDRGDGWVFKLIPLTSDSQYARRAPSGRRGRWVCYHGYRHFVVVMFKRQDMTSLSTIGPKGKRKVYLTWDEFEDDLPAFFGRQLGNMEFPVLYGELCYHENEEIV